MKKCGNPGSVPVGPEVGENPVAGLTVETFKRPGDLSDGNQS